MDPVAAMKKVNEVLFDYGKVTDFEQGILRTAIPFYTFARKNTPLQIKNLLSPTTRVAMKGTRVATRKKEGELLDERFLTDWMTEAPKIRAPEIIEKATKHLPGFYMLANTLPLFDAGRAFRMLQLNKGLNPMIDGIVSDMSPLLRVPIENALNYSTRFKKVLSKSKNSTAEFLGLRMSPQMKNALSSIRLLGVVNKSMETGGQMFGQTMTTPDKYFTKALLSFIGTAPYSYNRDFSRQITKSQYKRMVNGDIYSFKNKLERMANVAFKAGKKPTKADVDFILKRAKGIWDDAIYGNIDGKLSLKERNRFLKRMIMPIIGYYDDKIFTPEQTSSAIKEITETRKKQ